MKSNPKPLPGAKKYYRVSVYDMGADARWLESADFTRRPLAAELTPDRLPKLNRESGGRFEIRVGVMKAGEEQDFYGWTETRPATEAKKPAKPLGDYRRHDYSPDFTKTGDPCEICGFGRDNPVHA